VLPQTTQTGALEMFHDDDDNWPSILQLLQVTLFMRQLGLVVAHWS